MKTMRNVEEKVFFFVLFFSLFRIKYCVCVNWVYGAVSDKHTHICSFTPCVKCLLVRCSGRHRLTVDINESAVICVDSIIFNVDMFGMRWNCPMQTMGDGVTPSMCQTRNVLGVFCCGIWIAAQWIAMDGTAEWGRVWQTKHAHSEIQMENGIPSVLQWRLAAVTCLSGVYWVMNFECTSEFPRNHPHQTHRRCLGVLCAPFEFGKCNLVSFGNDECWFGVGDIDSSIY